MKLSKVTNCLPTACKWSWNSFWVYTHQTVIYNKLDKSRRLISCISYTWLNNLPSGVFPLPKPLLPEIVESFSCFIIACRQSAGVELSDTMWGSLGVRKSRILTIRLNVVLTWHADKLDCKIETIQLFEVLCPRYVILNFAKIWEIETLYSPELFFLFKFCGYASSIIMDTK